MIARTGAALGVLLGWLPTLAQAPGGRDVVQELNLARTRPAFYASLLEDRLSHYVGNELRRTGEITLRTVEGGAAVREAIHTLRAQAPLPPLEYSDALARAAADHVRDQGPSGRTGHDGTDQSTMRSRIERYGRWGGSISENIDYGSATAREVVLALLIDDGVPSRGHRRNIFDAAIRVAGAACGPHQRYGTMCVIDHAGEIAPR